MLANPKSNLKGNSRVQFTIRNYLPEDFQKLWQIDQLCFAPGIAYSRYELGVYIRRRNAFTLVAEDGSKITGFIVADMGRKRVGHIITIDVLAEARKQAIGSSLLQAAEQRLCSLNCRVVYLETAVDNSSAISFYKKHDYDVIETVPRYYSNGVDALVFAKNLERHLPQPGSSR
jgi:[ribosomal protein S18]-alanine N-acetyltransferase